MERLRKNRELIMLRSCEVGREINIASIKRNAYFDKSKHYHMKKSSMIILRN